MDTGRDPIFYSFKWKESDFLTTYAWLLEGAE